MRKVIKIVKPLEDVRIVSLEQYGAGPFGSVHLADLGAEIIKVEDPSTKGDVGRYVPPFQQGSSSLFFESFNRNKKSICIDINSVAGREVFERLVAKSDAVYSNLRGDVPAKLRITYDDLKEINPKIVCCSLSAYGMSGPRAKEPGYDYIIQGLAGWMSLCGEVDGPPTKTGLSVVDYSGGFVAAIALLAGIHKARRDGFGGDCDLSLFDTAISMLTYPAAWYLSKGEVPSRTRNSAHPSLVPFQNFETRDGWIVIGCAKEKFWQRLVQVLGDPRLLGERFASFAMRAANKDELIPLLEQLFKARDTEDWLEALMSAQIPCGPVNDLPNALTDPQVEARQMVVETDHPTLGKVGQVGSPIRVAGYLPEYQRAPLLGEHKMSVLKEILGLSNDEISQLDFKGAFGEVLTEEMG